MKVVYALETADPADDPTLFLAGPTPRTKEVLSWRLEALTILKRLGFMGTVILPEPRNGEWNMPFEAEVEWKESHLIQARVILFWMPRDMRTMPGLTTNDLWGYWKGREPGKLVFGAPPNVSHVRYQYLWAQKLGIPTAFTLENAIALALNKLSTLDVKADLA